MCYNKHMKKVLYKNHFQTPIGEMLSISDHESLYLLEFVERKNLKKKMDNLGADLKEQPTFVSRLVEEEVQEYFLGKRREFDLPLVFQGTVFQKKIWLELEQIPFGQTKTYKEIAQKIDNPNASIAVGAANASNHFAIVIPCHRLKSSSGQLSGYAAGIWRKQWLLHFEEEVACGE